MAELVWRYSPQDTSTAHLVYTGGGTYALAAVSGCGLTDAGSGQKWKGVLPGEARHLASIRKCPRCTARFPAAAEVTP